MKKILLSMCAFISLQASAQVLWQQDFSSATSPALPMAWLQINVDGLTPHPNVAAYTFGTNAWVTRDFTATLPAYGKVAASCSWYNPAGVANDWLITPQFTPTAGMFLEWEAAARSAGFQDGYKVKIATNGGSTVADFTVDLLTVAKENTTWTKRAVELSAYAGQNIRAAIVNNSNDMDILFFDNMKVWVPTTTKDLGVQSVDMTRYFTAGSKTITGIVRNNGSTPLTQAVLNYQVGTSPVVTQTIPFANVTYTNSAPFTFTTPANIPAGELNFKVWVSNVNASGADAIPANDTVKTFSYVASKNVPINALIEEFTSSTCPPCKTLNATFDPLLNSNGPNTGGKLSLIKYQQNYPSPGSDASFNKQAEVRHDFYGVSGIPTTVMNGRYRLSAHDQAEIDNGKTEPAYADITATLSRTGDNITASSTITPWVTISQNSPIRIHQVLAQQFYKNPGNTTGQTDYYHVMRKMNPDGVGAAATLADGVAQNFTFNNNFTSLATPAQLSFDLWNSNNTYMEYIVFVQDTISGHILQSLGVQTAPTGIVNLSNNQTIGIFPNPANTNATLAIKTDAASIVDVKVLDLTGKVVYTVNQNKLNAGANEITFSTVNFVTGVYNVIVTADGQRFTTKLVVAH